MQDGYMLKIFLSTIKGVWPLLLLIIVVLLIIEIISFLKKNKGGEVSEKEERFPYVKKQYLMTNREREFFFKLKEQYGDKYCIVPQVPLSKIVDVNHYEKHQWGYRSKIDKKTLDYVLFDPVYFTPQIVIELDDSSHELPERKVRDTFVDKVLGQVQIPIKHISTK
jgi:hypothetical protein